MTSNQFGYISDHLIGAIVIILFSSAIIGIYITLVTYKRSDLSYYNTIHRILDNCKIKDYEITNSEDNHIITIICNKNDKQSN